MKFFTFMIIPSNFKKIKKIIIPSKLLYILIFIFFILVFFVSTLFIDYFSLYSQLSDLKQIKLRDRKLNQQLFSYKSKIKQIEDSLERMNILMTRLKMISNLRDPERYKHIEVEDADELIEDIDNFSLRTDESVDNQFKNMQLKFKELEYKISFQEEELTQLNEYLNSQSALLASTPSIIPVTGWITSRYGMRRDPFTGKKDKHDGLDIATRIGTTIVAPADGVITYAGYKPGYGLMLVLDHGYYIATRYGHCSKFFVVHGDKVKRGTPIAAVGNTGRSTGPHLHYEVRVNGITVNPEKFILDSPF